jgi:putative oxidoreductase
MLTKATKYVLPPLDLLARFYLGGIFIYAAWGKILDPYSFALSIATYQMLPTNVVNLMAIALPWLEMVTGVLLVVGTLTRPSVLLINGMMVVFIYAIWSAVSRGLDMGSCGCFASEAAAEEISMATVWRDVWWLVIGVFILVVNDDNRWGLTRLWQWNQDKKWRAKAAEDGMA